MCVTVVCIVCVVWVCGVVYSIVWGVITSVITFIMTATITVVTNIITVKASIYIIFLTIRVFDKIISSTAIYFFDIRLLFGRYHNSLKKEEVKNITKLLEVKIKRMN